MGKYSAVWHWLSMISCVLSDKPECGESKEDENEVQTAIGETTNTGKLPYFYAPSPGWTL